MISRDFVIDSFSKCKQPVDFIQKYKYFKIKNRQKEKHDIIQTLRYIEEKSILGALYIAVSKEPDYTTDYIEDFLTRNRQLLIDGIQIDNDSIVIYMQAAYICAMYINKEERDTLFVDIFKNNTYRRAEQGFKEFENEKYVTEHYSKVLLSALTKFPPDIVWEEKYCVILTSIFKARGNNIEFLHRIEVGLRKKHLGYLINNKEAKKYFDLLCSYESYDSARFFLDNFDGSKGFLGLEMHVFIEMLLSIPDPGLMTVAKWYQKQYYDEDYTYTDWYNDVIKYNHDNECIKWIRLTVFYHTLKVFVEEGDWENFEESLASVSDYAMFDMERITYVKQLVECFAFIVNKMLQSKTDLVLPFLNKIAEININSYHRTKYLSNWNQKDSIREEYNYSEIESVLFNSFALEDVVYIYMNSHLKSIIYLEEFVEKCASKRGEDLFDLFKDYPLWGSVALGSKRGAVRDKLYITPIGIASNVSFTEYIRICETYGSLSREAQSFNKKMIRSQQYWYSRHKSTAELIRAQDRCTFYIKSYRKHQGILATDLALPEDIEQKRIEERNTRYPEIVINWLSQIQSSKMHIKWDEEELIYGTRELDINKRVDIAIEILNTIYELQSNVSELSKFIFDITNAPLKEINEASYYSTQRRFYFSIPKERLSRSRSDIIKKAKILLENQCIPMSLRKDIYLNTCIRKYYDLYNVCKYIGSELYSVTAEEPLIIALRFEEEKNGWIHFSTRGIWNTFYSKKHFIYRGNNTKELKRYGLYLVTLGKYDYSEGCFILDEIDLRNDQTDQWKRYLRKVRDIKKVADNAELVDIKNDLRRYNVRISSQNHISQFVYELNLVFRRYNFSIDSALRILEVIGETNPFIDSKIDFSTFKDAFMNDYSESYECFLIDYKTKYKSEMGFCDLYFTSFLKVFITREEFINNLTEDSAKRKLVLEYCKYRRYF